MLRINNGKVRVILFLLLTVSCLSACKKSEAPGNEQGPLELRKDKIINNLDSIYLYAREIYLWNEQLPSAAEFNAGRFFDASAAQEIDLYRNELFAFTRFAINPANNSAYEHNLLNPGSPKYSSLIENGVPGSVVANTINTSENNYGIAFAGTADNEIRILYVDRNSSAGIAGLKRGQKVMRINGQPTAANQSYYSFILSALNGQTLELTVETVNGDPASLKIFNLANRPYTTNPVLKSAVLDMGTGKAGYVAYRSFTAESNSRQYLDAAFSLFATKGISELIIDLRYNGGGYQNTSNYLANKIAPASADGKVMFTETYNKMMQEGKAVILANQPILGYDNQPIFIDGKMATLLDIDYSLEMNKVLFQKEGPLFNLSKVTFIVSNKTASASELLINVLKPYMDVRIIGVSADGSSNVRTYGKPVGFFDINIDKYKVYLSLYQDRNADNEGDFFDGLPADVSVSDNSSVDFGDVNDPALQAAMGVDAISSNVKKAVTANKRNNSTDSFNNKVYIMPADHANGMIKTYKDYKFRSGLKK